MKAKILRKWNNIIHRDFGYFFFGLTIIYSISGIALNHKVMKHWNPEYVISVSDFKTQKQFVKATTTDQQVKDLLKDLGEENKYKKHYFPSENELKVFLDGGNVYLDTKTGQGTLETLRARPFFKETSYLHYNPNLWWTYFSDIYAFALFTLAVTGLFIIRGKNGITGRGAWLTIAGVLIPVVFLIIFS